MLCAGLIGALVELRVAVVLVAALGLLTLEPVLRSGQLAPGDGAGGLSVAAYVVIIGGCIIGVRGVLERNARRIDDDAARRDEIERQQRLVEGVENAMRRQERLLHETVLNTLTAIHRGGLGSTPAMGAALEERCLEAIDVLSDLETGAQSLEPDMAVSPLGYVTLNVDLTAFIDGLRADGLRVDVVVDSLEDVPAAGARGRADRDAGGACERGPARPRHRAWVLVRVQRPGARLGRVSVRVEVRDDGVGFDPVRVRSGFGLTAPSSGPCRRWAAPPGWSHGPGAGPGSSSTGPVPGDGHSGAPVEDRRVLPARPPPPSGSSWPPRPPSRGCSSTTRRSR